MERENRFWRVILLALPLAVFAAFVVWPLASSFYYSFTNWNGFNPDYDYVGFANFLKIHTDKAVPQRPRSTRRSGSWPRSSCRPR